jgi:hypothetical protein
VRAARCCPPALELLIPPSLRSYQLVDDTLDFIGDEGVMGKKGNGSDMQLGLTTGAYAPYLSAPPPSAHAAAISSRVAGNGGEAAPSSARYPLLRTRGRRGGGAAVGLVIIWHSALEVQSHRCPLNPPFSSALDVVVRLLISEPFFS